MSASMTDREEKLRALRAALRVGIEEIEAGRYRTFATPEELKQYLAALTERLLARDDSDREEPT
jgi:hypothetical protein